MLRIVIPAKARSIRRAPRRRLSADERKRGTATRALEE
jgi:hypothetical protein